MFFPLPLKILLTVFNPVELVAFGFWINSIHDVLVEFVQVVPQFVPGEHKFTVPLWMLTWAYEFVPRLLAPSPLVKKKVTPATSDVTTTLLPEVQNPTQLLSPPAIQ